MIAERLAGLGVATQPAVAAGHAWTLLDTQSFDLLLLDLEMPGLRPAELISYVRQQPRTRHLPVTVIASPDDARRLSEAFEAGAGSCLTRPLQWSVVEHHLDVALRMVGASRRARNRAQQAVACGRAKEAIIGNVCGESHAAAVAVLDEVDRIWRALPGSSATPAIIDGLRRISREAAAMRNVAERAESLVEDVRQSLGLVERNVGINALIERTLDDLDGEAQQLGVRLVADLPAGETEVTCDPAAIDRALRNIVANAIQYSPSDSNVSISVSVYPDGLLAIDVTDEGEGMHPDYVARCLTPLRARSGPIAPDGRLGFGLPMAKAIMEAHEGSLEIHSMPGEGTTALLILPAERVARIGAEADLATSGC